MKISSKADSEFQFHDPQTNISKVNSKINENSFSKILFLLPPTLQFSDFVNPPPNVGTIKKGNKEFGLILTDLPLGIVSLSAYLKQHISNIIVDAIDFNVLLNKIQNFKYKSFREFFQIIINNYLINHDAPSYIGISALFTSSHQSIIDLAEITKTYFPKAKILVGGNYPTAVYAELLNASEAIDAICYGEGEKGLLGLLTAGHFKDYIKSSGSWVDRDKLKNPLKNLKHDFIVDLDEIPPYDYDCLDLEGYKINPNSSRYAVKEKYQLTYIEEIQNENNELPILNYGEETIGSVKSIGELRYSMPIMTSRGCPFKCTFCASHAAHGRDMRYHSIQRVMDDIKRMVKKYGIDGVVIQDDHFMAGKHRPYNIVKQIGELGLGMYFQNALAIYALDLDFLKLLKKSGVDSLVLPIESGSNRVLKEIMKKPLRLDIIPRVLRDCREAGIFTDCNIIIGMPGETRDDIDNSISFLKTIYADWFRIFTAMPIAGSDMYLQCLEENLFEASPLNANYKRSVINTGNIAANDITEITYSMNIELNFINNSNIRLGKFEVALESFLNVLKVKEDHSIAHFYTAICYEGLGDTKAANAAYGRAMHYLDHDSFWETYVDRFSIPIRTKASFLAEGLIKNTEV
jgi:anaerobic magnesium-protoporphyrin IX monomethyl ester cyclase